MSRRTSGPQSNRRISAGARSAPYARPEAERRSSSQNLNQNRGRDGTRENRSDANWEHDRFQGDDGTSAADIDSTFRQYGKVLTVQKRDPPGPNHPSVAYYVAFNEDAEARKAVRNLDKALADGRILTVGLCGPPMSSASRMLANAGVGRAAEPAPRMAQQQQQQQDRNRSSETATKGNAPRAQNGNTGTQARIPTGPRNPGKAQVRDKRGPEINVKAPGALSQRLMGAGELRALQRKQTLEKRAAAIAKVGAKTGVAGKGKTAFFQATQAIGPWKGKPAVAAGPLGSRIAPLPLAQRLQAEDSAAQRTKGRARRPSTFAATTANPVAAGQGSTAKGKGRRKKKNNTMEVD